MTLPATAHELQQAMVPLNKEERRLYANTIATAFTQRHPLGTTDPKEMMLLRHAFVCLPTPDIEKYMGSFSLGLESETRIAYYLGQDPKERKKGTAKAPFWASTCRMLQAQYNAKAMRGIFSLGVNDVANANAQVFAGLYAVAYEKQWYGGFAEIAETALEHASTSTSHNASSRAWMQPFLFDGIRTLPDESKVKIWMMVSHLRNEQAMKMFTDAMGWDKQWALAESLLGDHLFTPDHKMREIALRQLVDNKEALPMYELPAMDLNV